MQVSFLLILFFSRKSLILGLPSTISLIGQCLDAFIFAKGNVDDELRQTIQQLSQDLIALKQIPINASSTRVPKELRARLIEASIFTGSATNQYCMGLRQGMGLFQPLAAGLASHTKLSFSVSAAIFSPHVIRWYTEAAENADEERSEKVNVMIIYCYTFSSSSSRHFLNIPFIQMFTVLEEASKLITGHSPGTPEVLEDWFADAGEHFRVPKLSQLGMNHENIDAVQTTSENLYNLMGEAWWGSMYNNSFRLCTTYAVDAK